MGQAPTLTTSPPFSEFDVRFNPDVYAPGIKHALSEVSETYIHLRNRKHFLSSPKPSRVFL